MELYELLPEFIRLRDSTTSTDLFDPLNPSKGPVLQRVLDCIQKEIDVEASQISGLRDLIDPDTCDASLLVCLSRFLGSSYVAEWSTDKKRLFVKSLVQLYHTGGTSACWYALLRLLGYSKSKIFELWKTKANEDTTYTQDEDYTLLPAARIDVYSQTDELLNGMFTELEHTVFDGFRPIHVLLRNVMLASTVEDTSTAAVSDAQAAQSSLTVSEALAEAGDEEVVISMSCTRSCETACQAGCTTGCEASCETGCEASEEVYTGDVLAVDPATYGPLALAIASGVAGTFTGSAVFIDPTTFIHVELALVAGVVVTVFTGDVGALDAFTGFPVVLRVGASGRFLL